MNDTNTAVYQVDPMDMLSLSILVPSLGIYLNKKIKFLGDNFIPPAVTGGLLFSTAMALLYQYGDIELEFDMRFRDLLLLVFFSTVGLSTHRKTLVAGGKALVMITERDGVHCTSTLKFVSRSPSDANWSSRGVSAPRTILPSLKPGCTTTKIVHEDEDNVWFVLNMCGRKAA